MRNVVLSLSILVCIAATPRPAQAELRLEPVVTGLSSPLLVTHAPGDAGRLFIVQQGGQILILRNGVVEPTPFLDLSGSVVCCGERGLLGLAFHPDYAQNGYFFVNYTRAGDGTTHISRFSVSANPDLAEASSEVVLLSYAQPFTNHNGGMIAFGPHDGYLYIASGDGGSGHDPNNAGQDLNTLLGKILRIDVDEGGSGAGTGGPDYDIPPTNPFAGAPGVREEIWAYGLRNPWRMSFDRNTGDLWIGDVGQNAREELNFQPAGSAGGENYGWRVFEGTRCNTNVATQPECDALAPLSVFPIHEYDNPDTGRSITGGYVYRGSAMPALQGTYFFADHVRARVWSLRLAGGTVTHFQEHTGDLNTAEVTLAALASFGEDAAGELYLVSLGGTVWKFVDDAADCTTPLSGPCPPLQAEGAAAYTALGEDWNTADLDANGLIDAWEALLFERVLCGLHPLQADALCAYQTYLAALAAEPDPALFAPHARVFAALLAISPELQSALRQELGLVNSYVTAGAAFTAAGDPDDDGLANAAEYLAVVNAGGTPDDYVTAALHPWLDGSGAIALGMQATAALAAAALAAVFFRRLRKRWPHARTE